MSAPAPTTAEANIPRIDTLSAAERSRAASVVSAPALKRGHEFRTGPQGQEIAGHKAIAEATNQEWRDQRAQDTAWQTRNQAAEHRAQQATNPQEAQQIRDQEFQQQVADWAAHIAGSDAATVGSADIWQGQSPTEINDAIAHDPILHRLGFDPANINIPDNDTATNQQKLAYWLEHTFYGQYCEEGDNGTQRLVADLMNGADFDTHGNLRNEIRDSKFLQTIYGEAGDVQLLDAVRLATEVHARESVYRWPDDAMNAAAQGHDIEDRTAQGGIHEPNVFAMLDRHAVQPPAPEPTRTHELTPHADVIAQINAAQQILQARQAFRGVDFATAPQPTDTNDPRNEHYFGHPAQPVTLTDNQREQLFPEDNPGEQYNVIDEAVMYGGTTEVSRAQALIAADRIVLDAFGTTQQEQEAAFGEMLGRWDNWRQTINVGDAQNPDRREFTVAQIALINDVHEFRQAHTAPFATEDDLRAALQAANRTLVLRIADPQEAPEVLRANGGLPSRENMVTVEVNGQQVFLEIDRDATIQRWVQAHARIAQGLEQGQITTADQENFIEPWAAGIDHDQLWDILQHAAAAPTPEPTPHPTGETITPHADLVQAMQTNTDAFQTQSGINISAAPQPGDVRHAHYRADTLTGFVATPDHPEALLANGQPLFQHDRHLNSNIAGFIPDLSEAYNVQAHQGRENLERLEGLYPDLGSSLAAAAAAYGGTTPESRAMYLLNAYNLVLEAYGNNEAQRATIFRAFLEAQQRGRMETTLLFGGGQQVQVDRTVLAHVYLENELRHMGTITSADQITNLDPNSDRMFALRVTPINRQLTGDDYQTHTVQVINGQPFFVDIDIDGTIALWNTRYADIQTRIHQGQLTPEDARQITIWSDGVRQDEIVDYLATAPLATPAGRHDSFAPPTETAESHTEIPSQGLEMATAIDIREHHDDRVFTRSLGNGAIFIAADGMTNPAGGGIAADLIIAQFAQRFPQDLQIATVDQARDLARQAWAAAQTSLNDSRSIVDGAGAAISIGILVTINGQQQLITVQGGDTTMFRLRNGQLDVLAPRQSGLRAYYEHTLSPQQIDYLEGFVDEYQLDSREFQREAVHAQVPQLTPALARTIRDQMLQVPPNRANIRDNSIDYHILTILGMSKLDQNGMPTNQTLFEALQNPSLQDDQLVQLVSECLVDLARDANNLVSQGTLAKGGSPFEPVITVNQVEPGDRYVAVTDGITDNERRSTIGRTLMAATTPAQAASELRPGGMIHKPDDYTAATVFVRPPARP